MAKALANGGLVVVRDSREQDPFDFSGDAYAGTTVEQGLQAFAVVVEGTFYELAHGDYRSQLNPHAAVQSVSAFMARMRVPFVFAGSRDAAMYAVWSFLHQFVQGKRKELKAIEKSLGLQKKASVA